MSDVHHRVFTQYLMEQDGLPLNPSQRAELHAHLLTCPSCRADRQLYLGLRSQADQRWQTVTAPVALEKILRGMQGRARLRQMTLPLRALIWVGFALLALVLVQWIFTRVRPIPAVLPPASPTPDRSTPTPLATPAVFVDVAGKLTVEPLLHGEPSGQGSWSPEGDYFFVPILDMPAPGSDRRSTSLHFIAAGTGEDCPATETFLGQQGSQNYAWLDNGRVLFIDKRGRPLLFTPCQAGAQDLSDHFTETLLRVAMPLTSQELAAHGPLLLEASSAYWLLDPATLQARPLADPVPSPDQSDGFAWRPTGRQMSVLQPVAGKPEFSRLVLLDLDSGQVLRSMEIEASNEGRAPLIEWLGPERPFVWSFGAGGPLLVDLSVDPPRQVRVLPELFGLNLMTYPDQISSMGVFYSSVDGGYHIVAHVNLPEDKSIYLYHGENGQVEKLAGDRNVMMILPGDQRMPLELWQDTPTYDDGYDLVRVDAADQSQTLLQVSGHIPRNSPYLQSRLLPGSKRMLFGSTQGISLVGLPGGETLAFWQLVGAETSTLPTLSLAPNGRELIAVAHLNDSQIPDSPLYWLSLEK